MKFIRIFLPITIVTLGFVVTTTSVTATPEMTKKEKTGCKTCHAVAKPTKGEPGLNKVGECYKGSKDLKKCQA
jgi:cytochrome c551/c552